MMYFLPFFLKYWNSPLGYGDWRLSYETITWVGPKCDIPSVFLYGMVKEAFHLPQGLLNHGIYRFNRFGICFCPPSYIVVVNMPMIVDKIPECLLPRSIDVYWLSELVHIIVVTKNGIFLGHRYITIDKGIFICSSSWSAYALKFLIAFIPETSVKVRSQVSLCGIFGGESGDATGFSPSTSVFTVSVIPLLLHTQFSFINVDNIV